MQLSHFWVAAGALCAGLFLSCLLPGGDHSETVYPEAHQQGVVAEAAGGLRAIAAHCRADFARFEQDHARRLSTAGATAVSTPHSRRLHGELRSAADGVTARMHEFERQFAAVAEGNTSEVSLAGLSAAASKVHDARAFYDGVADRWDSLSEALERK